MKDNELRGLVLKEFYDRRRDGYLDWQGEKLDKMTAGKEFDADDWLRACDQLGDNNLIEWVPLKDNNGKLVAGAGKINAFGVDVIEETVSPPISIVFDHSKTISVSSSSNIQIGDGNTQGISVEIQRLITSINSSSASDAQKNEAKSLIGKLLAHPLVSSIVGEVTSSLFRQ